MAKTRLDRKDRKRAEAIARNAAYQALSLEEKMARNSTKVRKKLEAKVARQQASRQ